LVKETPDGKYLLVTGVTNHPEGDHTKAVAALWKIDSSNGDIVWKMTYEAPEFTFPVGPDGKGEPIYMHASDDRSNNLWRGGTSFEALDFTSEGDAILGGAVGMHQM